MGSGAPVVQNLNVSVEAHSPAGYTFDFRPEHHPDRHRYEDSDPEDQDSADPTRPGFFSTGADIIALSQVSVSLWRLAGVIATQHPLAIVQDSVQYTFQAESWEDRSFESDKQQ